MKKNEIRIWMALCRHSRQVLSFFIGDGSMQSCKRLWRKLPYSYQRCNSFSDWWRAYNCLPEATHQKMGKQTGQTNQVERLNNTLRQRISRIVRKCLSFSKKGYMLNLHFKHFCFYYNINLSVKKLHYRFLLWKQDGRKIPFIVFLFKTVMVINRGGYG